MRLDDLPVEMVEHMLKFTSINSLKNVSLVNKKYNFIAYSSFKAILIKEEKKLADKETCLKEKLVPRKKDEPLSDADILWFSTFISLLAAKYKIKAIEEKKNKFISP